MSITVKKSCQHGETKTFMVSSGGGYVRVRGTIAPDQPKQICRGGGYRGSTIALHSTPIDVTEERLQQCADRWVQKQRYRCAYADYAPGICWCCGTRLQG